MYIANLRKTVRSGFFPHSCVPIISVSRKNSVSLALFPERLKKYTGVRNTRNWRNRLWSRKGQETFRMIRALKKNTPEMGLGMFAITALRKASQSNAVEISTKPLANNIGDNAEISRNTRKYRKYGLMQKYVGICGPHFFSRVDQKIYSRIWLRGRKTICENMRKIRGTMRKYANNPPFVTPPPLVTPRVRCRQGGGVGMR